MIIHSAPPPGGGPAPGSPTPTISSARLNSSASFNNTPTFGQQILELSMGPLAFDPFDSGVTVLIQGVFSGQIVASAGLPATVAVWFQVDTDPPFPAPGFVSPPTGEWAPLTWTIDEDGVTKTLAWDRTLFVDGTQPFTVRMFAVFAGTAGVAVCAVDPTTPGAGGAQLSCQPIRFYNPIP